MPNRLIREDSPYLQQHAHNPVDWWPWCDEAFARALAENRPIFLSVGYSSCHWCHVMEQEVFEDEAIARYLNEHFVSIKVDREERPDIDKYYQGVHQLLNQRPGGWPLSIFMTPDKKPFFAGTYIPPVRKYNMMGFAELIEVIDTKWRSSAEGIVKNADEIQRFLAPKEGPIKAAKLDLALVDKTIAQAAELYDAEWGGFSKAPKFPHASTIGLLLDLYGLTGEREPLDMATRTLEAMALGGLYDPVDGGFCRYSTDDMWLVPHFEKMTYDNALLTESYLRAHRITGEPLFAQIAEETIGFMKEKMREGGLYYAASDADTEGEEGKYFLYDYTRTLEALEADGFSPKEARSVCEALSITPKGNFEGRSIVRFTAPARPAWWPRVRRILRRLREPRTYPFIDKKVITSWNGMMAKSLFLAAEEDERHLHDAIETLTALSERMWPGEKRLYHSALMGKAPVIEAFLEDYAYLADAMLQAYRTTLEEAWLRRAQRLADIALERFYERGKWLFSRGEFTTESEITDGSYPSSAAVMTGVLLTLGSLVDPRYAQTAFKTLEYYSLKIARHPIYHPAFTAAAIRYLTEDIVIKSLPNRLKEAQRALKSVRFPYLLYKSEIDPAFTLCRRQSCFARCDGIREVVDMIEQ
ncbi:thioredoxin domain-containing protein [Hydrogenimonas sp.]